MSNGIFRPLIFWPFFSRQCYNPNPLPPLTGSSGFTMSALHEKKIGVIGLGYVGLPLAVEFGKAYDTIGFDIDQARVEALRDGIDTTLEVEHAALKSASRLRFTHRAEELKPCDIYIITVPTPVNPSNQPDLSPLLAASRTAGQVLDPGNVVIYESTVFPGATEEVCAPILAEYSGLTFNRDFFVGYSPERINPGDKQHRLTHIVKVTSGSTPQTAQLVDELYASIVTAGTHRTTSIKAAEAAKVIENTQRDLNIALINELAMIFHRMDIDTEEVLKAAGTKWNFLPFTPGLVGGHCIGVDPYYLTYKAQQLGYHPEVILAGRRVNDGMGAHVVQRVIKKMLSKQIHVNNADILILGLTFKENCPDIRNTRVIDIVNEFSEYNANVEVYDPWADAGQAQREYGITLRSELPSCHYDAIILAVAHDIFRQNGPALIHEARKPHCVVFDVKRALPRHLVDDRL